MANRYFVNGGVDNNWGSTSNWSLTDGGTGGQAVPTASDDVFLTSNSPACTVNTTSRVALSLNFTGYSNTIAMSQQITVSGNVTLAAAMTITGSGALLIGASATLTSNGKTWPNPFTCAVVSPTLTFADDWTISGLVSIGTGSNTYTLNGSTLNLQSGFTLNGTSTIVTGTTLLKFIGTSTLTFNASNPQLRSNTTIDTAGTITLPATFVYNTGTLTHVAGTVVASSSTLSVSVSSTTTLACSGVSWGAVSLTGSITVTLSQDLNSTGLVTLGTSTNAFVCNGAKINCPAGFRSNISSGSVTGSTVINLTGTGTVDQPNLTTGFVGLPITVNAPGSTVTFSGTQRIDPSKFSYTAGTVVTSNTWPSGGLITQRAFTGGLPA